MAILSLHFRTKRFRSIELKRKDLEFTPSRSKCTEQRQDNLMNLSCYQEDLENGVSKQCQVNCIENSFRVSFKCKNLNFL